uniref:Uncharacterized protein n=1 Tax=Trypanosoma congolense (strain IL3000) TaxID=1068625 RepID=G0UJ76_TRYCI|nr:conserved hypothetical protein [Trypanosoma congolense IL3000]
MGGSEVLPVGPAGMRDVPITVHSLPVKTNFRGTTDVDVNFTRQTVIDSKGELHNTLRGRKLIGHEVKLPSSHVLVCASFHNKSPVAMTTAKKSFGVAAFPGNAPPAVAQVEAKAHDVHIKAVVDRFAVWEHDKVPERSQILLQWLQLAGAVHSEQ